MGSHAGLKKVVKSVKGKKGVVKRSYWVKAKEAVKGAGRAIKAKANEVSASQGRKNAARYKRGSIGASAGTGARIGMLAGLMGAHRTRHGVNAAHVGSQLVAAGTRRATGTQGKSIGKKILHGLGTYAGTTGGMLLGGMAHELGRAGIRAGVNAIRNRRRSA